MGLLDNKDPLLMAHLGMGLLASSQAGPRQNVGANLLSSLQQYSQSAAQRRHGDLQEQEFAQRKKLQDAQMAQQQEMQQRQQGSLNRVGRFLDPNTPQIFPEAGGQMQDRQRSALLDYGMNVEPKALMGLLDPNSGEGQFGLNPVQGMIGDTPALLQLNSKGGARQVQLPSGFNLTQQQVWKDTGGAMTPLPARTGGRTDAPVPITLAPNETVPYKGAAAAATSEGVKIGEQRSMLDGKIGALESVRESTKLLSEGIYSGAYANIKKQIAKGVPGMDKSTAARTEAFLSHIGNVVIPRLKDFGGNDSNEEMRYLQRIMGGDITLEPEALRKILESAELKIERGINKLQPGAAPPAQSGGWSIQRVQ